MRVITRDELRELLDSDWGGTLVEVLSDEYFNQFHLPGAIQIPLGEHFQEQFLREVPDKDAQVVLYCLVHECTASAEAARQLEELGYTDVYDYEEGKTDWRDAGLPIEHAPAELPR